MEQPPAIKKISSILALVILTPIFLVYGAVSITYEIWKATIKKDILNIKEEEKQKEII